ncbi:FmdB family zinc ribbon protein [Desulfovibrio litoralis]|uniref:Putative regulatory protein, FmdB family n=1 Tax=Desulfovibrio litoralis DSM 11393 TaxID=1121455 RepID=A0A1M7RXF9_9BACT|nr:zinc ribbon domain-containing protein [Desulfovibrio litoralis]SHN50722.1 putative regulatory protein, FmdB family [Desulfovibrio litoralis DSM 11393]
MPIYEYHCEDCQQLFEHWQTSHTPQETIDCPICKGKGHKIISNTSFVLKGGGWYATEYGKSKSENTKDTDSKNTAPKENTATSSTAQTPASTPSGSTPTN